MYLECIRLRERSSIRSRLEAERAVVSAWVLVLRGTTFRTLLLASSVVKVGVGAGPWVMRWRHQAVTASAGRRGTLHEQHR